MALLNAHQTDQIWACIGNFRLSYWITGERCTLASKKTIIHATTCDVARLQLRSLRRAGMSCLCCGSISRTDDKLHGPGFFDWRLASRFHVVFRRLDKRRIRRCDVMAACSMWTIGSRAKPLVHMPNGYKWIGSKTPKWTRSHCEHLFISWIWRNIIESESAVDYLGRTQSAFRIFTVDNDYYYYYYWWSVWEIFNGYDFDIY